ncbi:FG-GAP repeat domain-containing protein [Nannocystis bainbridge]|uniref:VCBS repeat-containing protein n=1 Tax=Nannocystis bainbridge TaxID=2995303 RepID=A0ABT5ECL7_9BACT|nr:VCBS repeat-containing protein [Nannocystis bainbridge]MDC0723597.1 VCBS repeat-containing protein [Nannocystis bainbridge]
MRRRSRPASAPSGARVAGSVAAALVGATMFACGGDEGRCGPLARLCAQDGEWRSLTPRGEQVVEVDLDGDGAREMVVLDASGGQLAVAWPEGQRSVQFLLDERPVAIAALAGEVGVALAKPPQVAMFGVDASGRLERRRQVFLRDAPVGLVAADLAGDGAPELLVTIPEAGLLAVIDPPKATMQEHEAGRRPLQLAVGDVDGDADLDVVVVDARRALRLFLGTGDGALRAGAASPAAARMQWLTLADHDGDGDLDALTRAGREQVLVHRNDGVGRFSSPIALPFAAPADGAGLVAGPVAASGLVGVSVPSDLGFTTWFGKGSTWLGRIEQAMASTGSWVGASADGDLLVGGEGFVRLHVHEAITAAVEIWRDPSLQSSLYESAVTTGRLDADPLLDVAVVSDNRLLVFRGRADRSLEPIAGLDLEVEPRGMAIADVTGDGLGDILVSDASRVWLARAAEDGSFELQPPYEAAALPFKLQPLRTGPGQPATIAAISAQETGGAYNGPGAALLRFAADGSVAEEVVIGAEHFVLGLAPVDLDGDGVDELVMYGRDKQTGFVSYLVPEGSGFVAAATVDLGAATGLTSGQFLADGFAVGDLDGDGALDVVVATMPGVLSVFGLVDGTPAVVPSPGVLPPRSLRDLDGDGRVDAVTAISALGAYQYHRGHGDGTFAPQWSSYRFVDATAGAFAAEQGAQFDVVTLGRLGIATYLVRPVMLPQLTSIRPFHGLVDGLVVADLDADGHDDVATASQGSVGGVGVLWGAEVDALARGRSHSDGSSRYALAVGDIDGDGPPEVLAAKWSGEVAVFPFRPDGRDPPIVIAEFEGGGVRALAVGELDGETRPDLVALRLDGGAKVSLARGTGPRQFASLVAIAEVSATARSTLELGDVDGDGDLDILVRSHDAGVSTLVLAEAGGSWSATDLPGTAAMFGPPDARGRVDLVTQDGTAIYRHDRGAPDRKSLLLRSDSLQQSLLKGVADVDRDGHNDLAVADLAGTYVWLRSDEGVARVTLADESLDLVAFPDVDGDDRPDVVGVRGGVLFIRRSQP